MEQHDKDPDFIVKTRLEGPSNELTGLFWMTSQQHNKLWPKYHDVVIHDNTAKTNRYEMALSLFVGIDSNFKTKILAQALTKYETLADYKWILQCTLEATSNLTCCAIYRWRSGDVRCCPDDLSTNSTLAMYLPYYRKCKEESQV
ncbi:hypothetical protein RirG_013880 [Rhizophagus irregularis DAOM 197198w]|uniref:MULE transposase domain-containing protein n=1 Tax=Rhizophagus irregularis (strain DAOM 197198w) TaxID=1432141 RepID=A0A015KFZ3_RHIIW|nr:hypothetical protein RirG_013880 [Rhizophagus irregularis DAOM 197198w]